MQKFFLWTLMAIVAIAPLPLGSNRPLGWSLLSIEVGLLLGLWALHHLWTGQSLAVPIRRVRIPLIFFSITCLWVLVQLIPGIPFGLAHPGWTEVSNFFGEEVPGRITIDPDWTATILMRWLSYAGVFWLSLQLCRDQAAANTALKAFAFISAVYALYGVVALLGAGDTILLYEKWTGKGSLSSTFVNRNSYATFAGLGLISTVALIAAAGRKRSGQARKMRDRIFEFLSHSFSKNMWLYLGFFLIASALLLTGSRAGALSATAATILLVWQLARGSKKSSVPQASRAALVLIIGGVSVVLSGGLLEDRFAAGGDPQRLEVYQQTFDAFEDHVVLGSGLGSFPEIFPLYRRDGTLRQAFVEKAHNSYLENMLELGLPAAASLFLALGGLTLMCWRGGIERARDKHFALLGVAASVLVGLHSLVDFSLQIPAVTVSYMYLMGIAAAQSFSSRKR